MMCKKWATLLSIQALLIGVMVAIVFIQGCKKTTTSTPPANVIVVNGCTGTTQVIVKVNNSVVPNTDGLGFFDYTGYEPVTANINASVNFLQYAGNALCSTITNL